MNHRLLQSGLTLVELMITLAIMGIVASAVVPSFSSMIQNNQMSTSVRHLITNIKFSRNEAINRGVPVSLCPSSDQRTCTANTTWQQGWILFEDLNSNNNLDNGETLIRASDAMLGRQLFSTANSITFGADGFPTNNGAAFIMCDHRDYSEHARALVLSPSGNIRAGKAADEAAHLDSGLVSTATTGCAPAS